MRFYFTEPRTTPNALINKISKEMDTGAINKHQKTTNISTYVAFNLNES